MWEGVGASENRNVVNQEVRPGWHRHRMPWARAAIIIRDRKAGDRKKTRSCIQAGPCSGVYVGFRVVMAVGAASVTGHYDLEVKSTQKR